MKIFRRTTSTSTATSREAGVAIEPTADELAVVAAVRAQGGAILFGVPTRCPHCASYGLVEHVDEVAGTCDNRCPGCRQQWRITRRALQARRSVNRQAAAIPVGDGILVRDLVAV